MGDYDKDTQHLSTLEHGAYFLLLKHCWIHGQIPLEQEKRANIARMSMKDWKKIAATINAFFGEDGSQARATEEIEKAEIVRMRRAVAGQRGGFASGISKAIRKHERSKPVAIAKQNTEQISQQNPKPSVASHSSINTTSTVSEDRGLSEGKAPKRPSEVSGRELAEIYARKGTA